MNWESEMKTDNPIQIKSSAFAFQSLAHALHVGEYKREILGEALTYVTLMVTLKT